MTNNCAGCGGETKGFFCFVHQEHVCSQPGCVQKHTYCVIGAYSSYLIDRDFEWPPICKLCLKEVDYSDPETIDRRTCCLTIVHTSCNEWFLSCHDDANSANCPVCDEVVSSDNLQSISLHVPVQMPEHRSLVSSEVSPELASHRSQEKVHNAENKISALQRKILELVGVLDDTTNRFNALEQSASVQGEEVISKRIQIQQLRKSHAHQLSLLNSEKERLTQEREAIKSQLSPENEAIKSQLLSRNENLTQQLKIVTEEHEAVVEERDSYHSNVEYLREEKMCLERDGHQLENDKHFLEEQVDHLKKDNQSLHTNIQHVEEDNQRLKTDIQNLEMDKTVNQQLEKENHRLQKMSLGLEKTNKRWKVDSLQMEKNINQLKEERQSAENDSRRLNKNNQHLRKENQRLINQIGMLKKDKTNDTLLGKQMQNEVHELQNGNTRLSKDIQRLKKDKQSLERRSRDMENTVSESRSYKEKTVRLEQQLKEMEALKNEYSSRFYNAKGRLVDLSETLKQQQHTNEKWKTYCLGLTTHLEAEKTKTADDCETSKQQYTSLKTRIISDNQNYANIKRDLDELRGKCEQLLNATNPMDHKLSLVEKKYHSAVVDFESRISEVLTERAVIDVRLQHCEREIESRVRKDNLLHRAVVKQQLDITSSHDEHTELEKEHVQLLELLHRSTKERNTLLKKCESFGEQAKTLRDQISTTYSAEEYHTLKSGYEAVKADCEAAKADCKTVRAAYEAENAAYEVAKAAGETAKAECRAAKADLVAARSEREAAKADRDTAESECITAKTECETAKTEYETTKIECEAARAGFEAAKAECDAAKAECEAVKSERETVQSRYETVKSQYETAKVECESANVECEIAIVNCESISRELTVSQEFFSSLKKRMESMYSPENHETLQSKYRETTTLNERIQVALGLFRQKYETAIKRLVTKSLLVCQQQQYLATLKEENARIHRLHSSTVVISYAGKDFRMKAEELIQAQQAEIQHLYVKAGEQDREVSASKMLLERKEQQLKQVMCQLEALQETTKRKQNDFDKLLGSFKEHTVQERSLQAECQKIFSDLTDSHNDGIVAFQKSFELCNIVAKSNNIETFLREILHGVDVVANSVVQQDEIVAEILTLSHPALFECMDGLKAVVSDDISVDLLHGKDEQRVSLAQRIELYQKSQHLAGSMILSIFSTLNVFSDKLGDCTKREHAIGLEHKLAQNQVVSLNGQKHILSKHIGLVNDKRQKQFKELLLKERTERCELHSQLHEEVSSRKELQSQLQEEMPSREELQTRIREEISSQKASRATLIPTSTPGPTFTSTSVKTLKLATASTTSQEGDHKHREGLEQRVLDLELQVEGYAEQLRRYKQQSLYCHSPEPNLIQSLPPLQSSGPAPAPIVPPQQSLPQKDTASLDRPQKDTNASLTSIQKIVMEVQDVLCRFTKKKKIPVATLPDTKMEWDKEKGRYIFNGVDEPDDDSKAPPLPPKPKPTGQANSLSSKPAAAKSSRYINVGAEFGFGAPFSSTSQPSGEASEMPPPARPTPGISFTRHLPPVSNQARSMPPIESISNVTRTIPSIRDMHPIESSSNLTPLRVVPSTKHVDGDAASLLLKEKMGRQKDKTIGEEALQNLTKDLEVEKLHNKELLQENVTLKFRLKDTSRQKNSHQAPSALAQKPVLPILSTVMSPEMSPQMSPEKILPFLANSDYTSSAEADASGVVESKLQNIQSLIVSANSAVRELEDEQTLTKPQKKRSSFSLNVYVACNRFFLFSCFVLFFAIIFASALVPLRQYGIDIGNDLLPINTDEVFKLFFTVDNSNFVS